ncbi:MAG: hypothetical protein M3N59_03590 [bacterium]|nr:hypothetical protein [bacterium]
MSGASGEQAESPSYEWIQENRDRADGICHNVIHRYPIPGQGGRRNPEGRRQPDAYHSKWVRVTGDEFSPQYVVRVSHFLGTTRPEEELDPRFKGDFERLIPLGAVGFGRRMRIRVSTAPGVESATVLIGENGAFAFADMNDFDDLFWETFGGDERARYEKFLQIAGKALEDESVIGVEE